MVDTTKVPFGYGGGGGGGGDGGGGETYLFMRENKIVNKQLPQREKMTFVNFQPTTQPTNDSCLLRCFF